jgi:hypothetical protein
MAGNPEFVFPALDSLLSQELPTNVDQDGIYKKIRTSENGNMTDAVNLANLNSNQALVYGMYLSRNKTISDAAADLTLQNMMHDNGASETYARQGEINEWQAQNKLDTLFFLQLMFLYFMCFVVFIYLWRKGILPTTTYYWIMGGLTVVMIGVLFNRAQYTRILRDNRFWNRRYLSAAPKSDSLPTCSPPPPPTTESGVVPTGNEAVAQVSSGTFLNNRFQ